MDQDYKIISRRDFLHSTTMFSALLLLKPGEILPAAIQNRIGLQLYTLRHLITHGSLPLILEKIAAIGFTDVEFFGYDKQKEFWGYSPREIKKILKTHGLKSSSFHIDFEPFLIEGDEQGFIKMCKVAKTIGNRYVVVPWLQEQYRKLAKDYVVLAQKLNEAAALAKHMGLQLAYHNHDFEFQLVEGSSSGYDILLAETDKKLVRFQLDLYWCSKAGIHPVSLFQQHPGRFPLWHIKDMDAVSENFTEVGAGVIDFKQIFQFADLAGLKHFFVEQDEINGDPWQSISRSYSYVKEHLSPK